MTQSSALKPGHVSISAFSTALCCVLLLFSAACYCLLLPSLLRARRANRHAAAKPGGAPHAMHAAQKQNACISGTDTGILLND
ncbi:hypothetical protein [Paraburkholderia phenoliruptrix]|uniref:hypothetical protein n=1 Tax=Paraburkholderia phenoliruptrix TaxID=252970 RepID=UPI0011D265CC|nr:hypothetical protein [Paraburkholderia phenoliruptrix]MDR6422293.1 hypothetical protein [Paraburkholderia phenoliruptrix]WMY07114.1 hypothetical protein P3F88_12595 [Paraburkholderia phenoliruptrix]